MDFPPEVQQPPLEEPQQMANPVPKPKKPRKKYKARRFFNRNHIVKSRKFGTRRKVGYRRLYKRWRWRGNPGPLILAREVRVTPEMSAIIGRERASWAEITRLIWVYIKEHKLQNPDNGIFFKPDQQLATIIGTEGEYMDGFTMMKFVKKHILPNWFIDWMSSWLCSNYGKNHKNVLELKIVFSKSVFYSNALQFQTNFLI